MSKRLVGGNVGCKDNYFFMGLNGFPNTNNSINVVYDVNSIISGKNRPLH